MRLGEIAEKRNESIRRKNGAFITRIAADKDKQITYNVVLGAIIYRIVVKDRGEKESRGYFAPAYTLTIITVLNSIGPTFSLIM